MLNIDDHLFAVAELGNPKRFVKHIASTFSGTVVSPENIDVFASFVDSFGRVRPGITSAYISLYGDAIATFA